MAHPGWPLLRTPSVRCSHATSGSYARTSFLYCTRCGWSASFRRFRPSMYDW